MKHPFQSVPGGSSNITPPHYRAVKTMRMNKLVALFIIAIIVSPNLSIVRGQTLTLASFDVEYESGEDVSISGTATADANLTLVVVFNSTILYEANFTAKEDGNYSEEYEIPGNATEGVYTVTISSGGESVNADFTVFSDNTEESEDADLSEASDNSMELAENLIEQAEDAKENVEDEFDDLEDVGVPSEANSSYLQGIEYLDIAKEEFDAGNYNETSTHAFEAIQLFGDAYMGIQGLTYPTMDEPEDDDDNDSNETVKAEVTDETESPGRLAVAIERAYVYWKRLNDTVTRLGEEGFNVTKIVEALEDVESHLGNASLYQVEGNHTAAVREFRAARKSLGRIHGFIESRIKERRERQTEQFLAQFQRRVEKITGTLEGLQASLEAGKTRRVQAVLRSTAQRLLRLSDTLSSGNMTDVLDDLDDAVEALDDGLDELNGEGLSKQIKSASRFEAKIESLKRSFERLTNAGYNTSEFDEYLAEAQSLLSQIEEKLQEGDEDVVKELIEDAEDLIEDAQKLFKKLQKNTLKASRVTENGRRPENSGLDNEDGNDDEEDDHDEDGNISSSSVKVSDDVAGELGELVGVISRIEERLVNLSTTGVNTTEVEVLMENAKVLIEEAKALAEENPDEAKELLEVVEELLDEAIDLIEGKTETESNVSVSAFEPDDEKDDDESDDDEEDSTSTELPDEEPDDVEING
jgi:hypothetical protein